MAINRFRREAFESIFAARTEDHDVLAASWRRREATRQARRRDLNESIQTPAGGLASSQHTNIFVCECGDANCVRTLTLTRSAYETVRAHPNHFVVAANHENPETECVVAENESFAVVETLVGEASKIALRNDPRPLYSGSDPS